jgi:hypothetical protein
VEIHLNILIVRIPTLSDFSVIFSSILLISCLSPVGHAWGAPPARPASSSGNSGAKLQEIQVTLFGQPCTMSGPFPKNTLILLHEISPEKIPPDATVARMRQTLKKASELKSLPLPLQQYRDHLRKRLSAKIALEEALTQSGKSAAKQNPEKALASALANLKEHVSTLQYPAFESKAKAELKARGSWNESFTQSLRDSFLNQIQPDTEEEFHKAIRLTKIQYVCTFDDGEHGDDGDSENESTED